MQQWYTLMNAITKAKLNTWLADLDLDNSAFASYLSTSWILYKKKLVAAYVDQYKYFRNQTFLFNKEVHSRLKSHLGSCMSNLIKLFGVWLNLMEKITTEYIAVVG